MSKDTPEVGDVFYSEEWGLKLVITFEKYGIFWGIWETGQSVAGFSSFDDKVYLGKSKANIDDLFKTENEE